MEPAGTCQHFGKVDTIMPLLGMWKLNVREVRSLNQTTANGYRARIQTQTQAGLTPKSMVTISPWTPPAPTPHNIKRLSH